MIETGYNIHKTDGSLVVNIKDSNIDQISTSLTLVGKNVSNYGEFINENFIHMLENFANTDAPSRPMTGQIWYDTAEQRLKVYDGTRYRSAAGPIVSPEDPPYAIQGDFWIDSEQNQLYFYTGPASQPGVNRYLAGPIYGKDQMKSGFIVETYKDLNNMDRTVVELWVAGERLGIFSKYPVSFEILNGLAGFGLIGPGFTQTNEISGLKFRTTVTLAEKVASTKMLPVVDVMPSDAEEGQLVYYTVSKKVYVYTGDGTGNGWKPLN